MRIQRHPYIITSLILSLSLSACQHQTTDTPSENTPSNTSADIELTAPKKNTATKFNNIQVIQAPSLEKKEVKANARAPKIIGNEQHQRMEMLEYASDQKAQHLLKKPSKAKPKAKSILNSQTFITATPPQYSVESNELYPHAQYNRVTHVTQQPVSTFSIDVDTASYSNVRRFLQHGQKPRVDAVRVEEMINYFSYDYPQANKNTPFTVITEVGPSPWNTDKKLIHIGIQGKQIKQEQRPASNLVFLIDVSGSMHAPNKLELLKSSLKMLSRQLQAADKVSMVVYAGAAGVVLPPTAGNHPQVIINALDQLRAGGSTHGSAGIHTAYQLAEENFIKDGINRVMIATDGDFNVGTVSQQALKQLIEEKRQSGISLSVLGFGMGNYNDRLMQTLAQNGNGNAYYIDNLQEAHKVLVEELSATLVTIAKDVKIQVEFNPNLVSEYQLIGYETRHLNREDFNNDNVDAGEIGAGHTVTALYEVALVDSNNPLIDDLRYQPKALQTKVQTAKKNKGNTELAFLRLRFKQPNANKSQLLTTPIYLQHIQPSLKASSDNYRFSAAVAAFGQLLRASSSPSTMTYNDIINLANSAKGKDENGYRAEFVQLVKLAAQLQPQIAGR